VTLLDSLQLGKQSAREMSANTGLTERAIRQEVMELRRLGYPIISGDAGYWISNDMAEIERCSSRLIAHGTAEIEIATKMLKRARLLGDAIQEKLAV